MVNKDKIVKVDLLDSKNTLVYSTELPIFPKDFFSSKNFGENIIMKGNNLPTLEPNQPMVVVIHYRNYSRIKYTADILISTDKQINATLRGEGVLMEERRNFFKIQTDIGAQIGSYLRGKEYLLFENGFADGYIKNINVGGIFLESICEFQTADTLNLKFGIDAEDFSTDMRRFDEDKYNSTKIINGKYVSSPKKEFKIETIVISGDVLRVVKNEGSQIFGYGIKFVSVPSSCEERILKYLYACQLYEKDRYKFRYGMQ